MKLMEMLRDKRLMFIGDSVQRGMFESMICLVQSALPKVVSRSLQRIPPRKVFRVKVPNPHARTHTINDRIFYLTIIHKYLHVTKDLISSHTLGIQRIDRVLLGSFHHRLDIGSCNESHRFKTPREARFRSQAPRGVGRS